MSDCAQHNTTQYTFIIQPQQQYALSLSLLSVVRVVCVCLCRSLCCARREHLLETAKPDIEHLVLLAVGRVGGQRVSDSEKERERKDTQSERAPRARRREEKERDNSHYTATHLSPPVAAVKPTQQGASPATPNAESNVTGTDNNGVCKSSMPSHRLCVVVCWCVGWGGGGSVCGA